MAFRSSASFGKRQEYIAVAELLRRDFDVYMTLVDDQQIDCVIRLEDGGKPRYLDVQIKARSKTAGQASTFSAMEIRHPRPNFWFIFYSEVCQTYWVVPSLRLIRLANQNKGGKNAGKYSVRFCNLNKAGWKPRPKFAEFENGFHLLRQLPKSGR